MSTPYLGEMRMFGFNFAPKTWAFCNGQLLSIQQNAALFSILGTTYGGNGVQTFALPNMQSRVPVHVGNQIVEGEMLGQEAHTLLQTEVPQHTHTVFGSTSNSTTPGPVNNVLATTAENPYATSLTGTVVLNPGTLPVFGSGQPHENRQPYLVVNFCICLAGVFPSRN